MSIVILVIALLGLLLIATSHLTGLNKSAVAVFACTLSWILYSTMTNVTGPYSVFLQNVGKASEIILFLLATMTIVEILNNNGCFDFISKWIRTRNTKRMLWTITIATFIVSANLDNLTTTIMMLMIMHGIIQNRRQRMLVGCAVIMAANSGGCFTVIGDPIGIVAWNMGAVTASNFSVWLALPAIAAWVVPTLLISAQLPDQLEVEWPSLPYRGDDTRLKSWQRILMLFIGIGGLWFIPTFHNISGLSPFLGAFCVLSVLWIANEIVNRKLLIVDPMIGRKLPMALRYSSLQQMLFIMGVMMTLGVVSQLGMLHYVMRWMDTNIHNIWITGITSGLLSALTDTFTICMSNFSLYEVVPSGAAGYASNFVQNGLFWKVVAFSTAAGGSLTLWASGSGLILMKTERMHVGWFMKNMSVKVLAGWFTGLLILWVETLTI